MDKKRHFQSIYLVAVSLPQIPSTKFNCKEFSVPFVPREPSDDNNEVRQANCSNNRSDLRYGEYPPS